MHSALAATPPATAAAPAGAVEAVRRILSLPDERLDYAEAKLTFDCAVDPSIDADAVLAELDLMAAAARDLAGAAPDGPAKLNALRKLIYQSGPWNGHRPFSYDHPNWKKIPAKLLSNYLATRRGQCISMPILFLILGERRGWTSRSQLRRATCSCAIATIAAECSTWRRPAAPCPPATHGSAAASR
jgi:hypothetical protein